MEIKKILIIILSIIFVIGIIAYLSANSYVSSTDSFSTRTFGSNDPYSLTTNGSDFWITDGFFGDKFVYHVDRNGVNQTDGFQITTSGNNNLGITMNYKNKGTPTDFWIVGTSLSDSLVSHYIPECNPALNQDWIIDGTQICDNREINIGTGNIIITTGHLYLINGANVSIKGINISNSGDKVFINKGSQLRRN